MRKLIIDIQTFIIIYWVQAALLLGVFWIMFKEHNIPISNFVLLWLVTCAILQVIGLIGVLLSIMMEGVFNIVNAPRKVK